MLTFAATSFQLDDISLLICFGSSWREIMHNLFCNETPSADVILSEFSEFNWIGDQFFSFCFLLFF